MASKSEVIIAGCSTSSPLGAGSTRHACRRHGRVVLPDFTISASDGRTDDWEHAGMLDLPDYARKWELKKAWYADNLILPHDKGSGPNGTLMWTDDLNGANARAWLGFASEILQAALTGALASPASGSRG